MVFVIFVVVAVCFVVVVVVVVDVVVVVVVVVVVNIDVALKTRSSVRSDADFRDSVFLCSMVPTTVLFKRSTTHFALVRNEENILQYSRLCLNII